VRILHFLFFYILFIESEYDSNALKALTFIIYSYWIFKIIYITIQAERENDFPIPKTCLKGEEHEEDKALSGGGAAAGGSPAGHECGEAAAPLWNGRI
jgi:hypothetical protein